MIAHFKTLEKTEKGDRKYRTFYLELPLRNVPIQYIIFQTHPTIHQSDTPNTIFSSSNIFL